MQLRIRVHYFLLALVMFTISAPFLKAHSDNLRLTHGIAADGCVSAEIGNFLFFRTAHFCRSYTRQTKLVWMSLKIDLIHWNVLLHFITQSINALKPYFNNISGSFEQTLLYCRLLPSTQRPIIPKLTTRFHHIHKSYLPRGINLV